MSSYCFISALVVYQKCLSIVNPREKCHISNLEECHTLTLGILYPLFLGFVGVWLLNLGVLFSQRTTKRTEQRTTTNAPNNVTLVCF